MVKVGYIFGAGGSYGLYAVLWCIAQSTRVDITACGQHMRACVCLVVGGTALVKMTQPIWDLDHLPKPAPRSDESDICHPGGAKLSLFPSRLFQGSARLPIPDRESWPITEAQKHGSIRRRSNRVVGIPGCILLPSSSTGSENPCPHHLDMWAEGRWPPGASSRGLRVVVGQWAWPGIRR